MKGHTRAQTDRSRARARAASRSGADRRTPGDGRCSGRVSDRVNADRERRVLRLVGERAHWLPWQPMMSQRAWRRDRQRRLVRDLAFFGAWLAFVWLVCLARVLWR